MYCYRLYMLTLLICGKFLPSHNFMKLYTRKHPNFLDKSRCY